MTARGRARRRVRVTRAFLARARRWLRQANARRRPDLRSRPLDPTDRRSYHPPTRRVPAFDRLVAALRRASYEVRVTQEASYEFAFVEGRGVKGGFCTPAEDAWYWYINGRFAADNDGCFDKWSKCPLVVRLPETDEEAQAILRHLEYLATPEGFEWSNSYGYFDDPRLPREERSGTA